MSATMEQVVHLVNYRHESRLTALAGGIMGFVLGVAITAGVGAYLKNEYTTHATAVLEQRTAALKGVVSRKETELASLSTQLKTLQRCAPFAAWHDNRVQALRELQSTLATFPVFKTPSYKEVFDRLNNQVHDQERSLAALSGLLARPDPPSVYLCAMAPQDQTAANTNPLWEQHGLALYPNGWALKP